MTLPTIHDVLRVLDAIYTEVIRLPERIRIAANQVIVTGGLSDISESLGTVTAGEYRSGNGVSPGYGFTGVRVGYPPFSYGTYDWSIAGVNDDVLQFGLNAADGTAWTGGGAVRMSVDGIKLYNGSTQTGKLDSDGDVAFGSDVSAAATTGFNVFASDQTYNSESMGAGDVLIGDNSSSKPNILWDKSAGQLRFRSGTEVYGIAAGGQYLNGVGCEIERINTVSISHATFTRVTLDDQFYDDADFWAASPNPTRITIPATGRYSIALLAIWEPNTTGLRQVSVNKNGNYTDHYVANIQSAVPTFLYFNFSFWELALTANDYLELCVYQTSGGALDLYIGAIQVRRTR